VKEQPHGSTERSISRGSQFDLLVKGLSLRLLGKKKNHAIHSAQGPSSPRLNSNLRAWIRLLVDFNLTDWKAVGLGSVWAPSAGESVWVGSCRNPNPKFLSSWLSPRVRVWRRRPFLGVLLDYSSHRRQFLGWFRGWVKQGCRPGANDRFRVSLAEAHVAGNF
jgi:hypothetical protein